MTFLEFEFAKVHAPIDRELEEAQRWHEGEIQRLEAMKRDLDIEYRRKIAALSEKSTELFRRSFGHLYEFAADYRICHPCK